LYPVLSRDLAVAEELLRLFLSRGVDINAGNASMRNWTALPSSTVRAQKRPFSSSCPRSHAGFKAIFQKVV